MYVCKFVCAHVGYYVSLFAHTYIFTHKKEYLQTSYFMNICMYVYRAKVHPLVPYKFEAHQELYFALGDTAIFLAARVRFLAERNSMVIILYVIILYVCM